MAELSLLQRLRERKLVQWALAYLAGTFVVFQLLDALAEPLGLSTTAQRCVLVIAAIGLPVSLVLAWYHGEKGRQRVSGPELLMVAALLVIAGVALSLIGKPPDSAVRAPVRLGKEDRPVIAVLPLDNLSPDLEYDFFAAGVQEDLTTKLQRISTVAVISRGSVEKYRDRATRPSIRQIASELGASYLLEGSTRIVRDSVRITVQLIEASTDTHLWAEDYDALYSVENYVRLQSEIVQRIASDLRAAMFPEDMAWLEAIPTRSLEAYEAYMKGNEAFFGERLMGLSRSSYASIQHYEEAVELDPRFALAHAGLALTLVYSNSVREKERIRGAAEKALSLAGEIVEARLALAYSYALSDQEESDRQLDLAEAIAPEHSLVVQSLANREWQRQEYDTSIQILLRAERLDPRDPLLSRTLGSRYMFLHRYDEAIAAFEREVARSDLQVGRPHHVVAFMHLARGEPERARSSIAEILRSDPPYPYSLIPTNYLAVVLRLMSEEERQLAFSAYTEREFAQGRDLSCSNTDLCLRRAIHETEVGSLEKAQSAWDSLSIVASDPSRVHSNIGYDYTDRALISMMVGEREAALKVAREGVSRFAPEGCRVSSAQTYVCPMLARVLAHFGEHDEAIALLEEMLPAPSLFTVHILEIDPIWDPLRSHPRFRALLEKYADDVEH